MLRWIWRCSVALLLWSLAVLAFADGAAALRAKLQGFRTLTADFTQVTLSGHQSQTLTGKMALLRPNHFKWFIETPYQQQFLTNGKAFWQYEVDIDQIIVKPLSAGLSGLPLLLLSEDVDRVLQDFTIQAHGVDVFILTAKDPQQAMLRSVTLRFEGQKLVALSLINLVDQTVRVSFDHIARNPVLDAEDFVMKVPPGVDVIEQQ